jgi:ABC-2 type transport system ATP-binding protein
MLLFDSISFRFGKTPIFEDINLPFEKGKTYGIVGSNGVGKTTLFRSIAGLYKLNNGQILIDQKQIHSTDVSFLPTDPFFYPYMKGIEYLEIIHRDNETLENCFQLAEKLNVPLNNLVDSYSTGMKKKLAFIARYTQDKVVSIYDEPFNGVDLESNEILLKLLQNNKPELITFISSHILGMLFEVSDQIIHIEKGFKISTYSPDQYNALMQKIRA